MEFLYSKFGIKHFAKMRGFTDEDLIVNNAYDNVLHRAKGSDAFLLTIGPELDAILRSAGNFYFVYIHNILRYLFEHSTPYCLFVKFKFVKIPKFFILPKTARLYYITNPSSPSQLVWQFLNLPW
jgi:hypothetical protein